jgi:hypothetical protein
MNSKPTEIEKKSNEAHANWEFAYVHPRYQIAIQGAKDEQAEKEKML